MPSCRSSILVPALRTSSPSRRFFRKTHAYKFARLSKFIIGWASHLYYWVYPGVMVGVTAIIVGYIAGQLWPETFSPGVSSPTLMIGFCVVFAFGVAYIAYRGVVGATGVNIAINVIQISALLDLLGDRDRLSHEPSAGFKWAGRSIRTANADQRRSLATFKTKYDDKEQSGQDKDGKPTLDKDGNLTRTARSSRCPTTSPIDKDGKPLEMTDGI